MKIDVSRDQMRVWPADVLHFAFFGLVLAVTAPFFARIPSAAWWIAFDIAAVLALIVVERMSSSGSPRRGAWLRLAHGAVVVPLVFTQVGVVIHALREVDHAAVLERLDRWLFLGTNPLEAIEAWNHPLVTELMQWAYTSYLLLPIGIVTLLAFKGREEVISRSLFALLGVMYLSYIGYFLVPAAGPNVHCNLGPIAPVSIEVLHLYRFTTDLPGVWMSAPLRAWIFAAELTKKDCFPSGHVAVAIVCWALARRVDRRFGLVFAILAIGVTLSTIYLRYHYVVDVIAGAVLAWFALTGWLRLHDWVRTRLERPLVDPIGS